MPLWLKLASGVVVGVGFGQGVVWLSQRLVTTWRWTPAVRLHVGLRQILGVIDSPLSQRDILIFALSSAIGEELFFRGWLLPLIGLILSSLVFGAVHYAPRSRGMWIWVPLAAVMGVAFGLMFQILGTLTAPIVAHFVINYRNLHFINTFDPELRDDDARELRRQTLGGHRIDR